MAKEIYEVLIELQDAGLTTTEIENFLDGLKSGKLNTSVYSPDKLKIVMQAVYDIFGREQSFNTKKSTPQEVELEWIDLYGNISMNMLMTIKLFLILADEYSEGKIEKIYDAEYKDKPSHSSKDDDSLSDKLAFDIMITGAKCDEILQRIYPDFSFYLTSESGGYILPHEGHDNSEVNQTVVTLLNDIKNYRQSWARLTTFADRVYGFQNGYILNRLMNGYTFSNEKEDVNFTIINGTQISYQELYDGLLDHITYANNLFVEDLHLIDNCNNEKFKQMAHTYIDSIWSKYTNLLGKIAPAFGCDKETMINSIGSWNNWSKAHGVTGIDIKLLPSAVKDAEFKPVQEETSNDNIKFCRYCGTKLQEDVVFCHNCGKKVR